MSTGKTVAAPEAIAVPSRLPPGPADVGGIDPDQASSADTARAGDSRVGIMSALAMDYAPMGAILVLGGFLLWMTLPVPTAPGGLERLWEIWPKATQVLFLIGIALILPPATRYSRFYPIALYTVSLEPVQDLVIQILQQTWPRDIVEVNAPFEHMTLPRLVLIVIGLYTTGFAVIGLVLQSSVRAKEIPTARLERSEIPERISMLSPTALRLEDLRRRRIKAYFSRRPLWPWLVLSLGLGLMIFAVGGIPSSQEQLFNSSIEFIGSLFAACGLGLLFGDRRRGPMYYLNLFVVLVLSGAVLLDWLTDYPFTIRAALYQQFGQEGTRDTARNALIAYYYWFWLIMGLIVAGYALLFRCLLYPRWHLATEAEVDERGASDFKDFIERGLERLDMAPSDLIAEPVVLRGFPDRSLLAGVFSGSWISREDRLRFTPQTATLVAFTADQVLYYDRTIDLTTGVTVDETNVEFFYQDVSNVARTSRNQVIEFKGLWFLFGKVRSLFSRTEAARRRDIKQRSINDTVELAGRDVFQINLDSGRSLVVVLRDNSFFDSRRARIISVLGAISLRVVDRGIQRDADLPIDDNERAMRTIRAMLREKKHSLLLAEEA